MNFHIGRLCSFVHTAFLFASYFGETKRSFAAVNNGMLAIQSAVDNSFEKLMERDSGEEKPVLTTERQDELNYFRNIKVLTTSDDYEEESCQVETIAKRTVKKWHSMFNQFDYKRDGALDEVEQYEAFLRLVNEVVDPYCDECENLTPNRGIVSDIMKQYDGDLDGYLTYPEFFQFVTIDFSLLYYKLELFLTTYISSTSDNVLPVESVLNFVRDIDAYGQLRTDVYQFINRKRRLNQSWISETKNITENGSECVKLLLDILNSTNGNPLTSRSIVNFTVFSTVIDKCEIQSDLELSFIKFDHNRDGVLTGGELRFLSKYIGLSEGVFGDYDSEDVLDMDRNGKVDYNEFRMFFSFMQKVGNALSIAIYED